MVLDKGYNIDIISHWQQEQKGAYVSGKIFPMPNDKNWTAPENFAYACDVVKNGNYDVIIYQDSYAPTETIVCHLSREYNVPLIVFEHNSPLYIYNKRSLSSWTTPKGFLRRLLHPYLLKKEISRKKMLLDQSSRYVLLSKAYIPEFCNLLGIKNDGKVTYINNPVTLKPISSESRKQKENILLYVGRLVEEKRVDRMLMLWSEISKEIPSDWRFIIVGDGPKRAQLQQMATTIGLKNVQFEGFQDPKPYYERSKLFIMMSKYEGWGLTLCEAMSQGVVSVVLSTFSSVGDIINNGHNGFLVSNEQECKQRMTQLMNGNVQWDDMSKNAILNTNKFKLEKIIDQWETLIKEIE